MEHLSLEHTAICSVLERSGRLLSQEDGRTAGCLLQVLASAFTCDLQIKLYPSHRAIPPELKAEETIENH